MIAPRAPAAVGSRARPVRPGGAAVPRSLPPAEAMPWAAGAAAPPEAGAVLGVAEAAQGGPCPERGGRAGGRGKAGTPGRDIDLPGGRPGVAQRLVVRALLGLVWAFVVAAEAL